MATEPTILYLHVRNWSTKFENNRTRGLKFLDWVPISNHMDSDGYVEIIDSPDGPSHFAFWIACVMMASRCENPAHRGVLLRDDGTPHTIASVARQCRIPAPLCEIATKRLLALGWLEHLTHIQFTQLQATQDAAGISHNGAIKPHHGEGKAHPRARVVNGTERNTTTPPRSPSTEGDRSTTQKATRGDRKRADAIAEIENHAKGHPHG